jgi:hypothetical protein
MPQQHLLNTVRPATPTCIVFGEHGDEDAKMHYTQLFRDPSIHRVEMVPNCAHNAVVYLNRIGRLDRILATLLTPRRMLERIPEIVSRIPPRPSPTAARRAGDPLRQDGLPR